MRKTHRSRRKPEHPTTDRWMVSYADFITLLFAFFTTLYAISNMDAQKMGRIVLAMKSAFDQEVLPDSHGAGIVPAPLQGNALDAGGSILPHIVTPGSQTSQLPKTRPKPLKDVKDQLDRMVTEENLASKIKVSLDRRGLIIRLGELNFFDSGSAVIKPSARSLLDRLAAILFQSDSKIRVEGHTDNVPISTSRYPSNWELSTARATSLVLYLIENHGFDPQKLSASGYGEFRPLAANDTDENRAQNRRVDLVVLNEESTAQEPTREWLQKMVSTTLPTSSLTGTPTAPPETPR